MIIPRPSIASYSLRARAGAPVAVPLEWRELTRLKSANQFGMDAVLKRIQRQQVTEGTAEAAAAEAEERKDEMHGRKKSQLFPMEALLVGHLPEGKAMAV